MSAPIAPWKRRLMGLLGVDPSGATSLRRSLLLPFFPSRSRGISMVTCSGCGSENPARNERCTRCRQILPVTATVRRSASLPVWLVAVLVAVVASAAFWLGQESGRQTAPIAPRRQPSLALTPVPLPTPTAGIAAPLSAADPLATAAGPTWAIYASQDRLTDRPILGARFGTVSGTPLFTVLCAEGQAALSLKRGLLPAAEGGSANSKSTVDTIRVGVRIGERERDLVELRFEDAPPEMLDAIPKRPLDFLRRVTASRRIRTATDDFDPTPWGDAITRVTHECRFEEGPGAAPKRAKARR